MCTDLSVEMFVTPLFITTRNCKQFECPINKNQLSFSIVHIIQSYIPFKACHRKVNKDMENTRVSQKYKLLNNICLSLFWFRKYA